MGTIQRLSGGNYILAIDGQIRTSCCCATTTGITCANNDPSMVLTITAPDGDLPITWCGKTWVASTETPGANEAYSGQPQQVCPTSYTLNSSGAETWSNSLGLFLRRYGLGFNRHWIKLNDQNSWQTDYRIFSSMVQSDLGILSTGSPLAGSTDYRIPNAWFTSYVTGNITYSWSRGTNW